MSVQLEPMRIIVSSCLMGRAVRYDGHHKGIDCLMHSRLPVDWIEVCPELEAGMGVPRPPVDLVRQPDGNVRVLARCGGIDWTKALRESIETLEWDVFAEAVDGAILKSKSPSCGVGTATLYAPDGTCVSRASDGVFAAELGRQLPDRICVDEIAFGDVRQRALFWVGAALHWRRRTNALIDLVHRLNGDAMFDSVGSCTWLQPTLTFESVRRRLANLSLEQLHRVVEHLTGVRLSNGAVFACPMGDPSSRRNTEA